MILTRTCITDLFLAKPSSDTSVQALSPRRGAGAVRPLGDSVNALGLCFLSLKNSPTGGASCRVSRCANTGSSCLHPRACLAGWRHGLYPVVSHVPAPSVAHGRRAGRKGQGIPQSLFPCPALIASRVLPLPTWGSLPVSVLLTSHCLTLLDLQPQLLHYPLRPAHTFDVVPCGIVLNW